MIIITAILFIPSETHYDVECPTNKFTVYNLDESTTSRSKKKRKAEDGSNDEQETEAKGNKIREKVWKLCEGDADTGAETTYTFRHIGHQQSHMTII